MVCGVAEMDVRRLGEGYAEELDGTRCLVYLADYGRVVQDYSRRR